MSDLSETGTSVIADTDVKPTANRYFGDTWHRAIGVIQQVTIEAQWEARSVKV